MVIWFSLFLFEILPWNHRKSHSNVSRGAILESAASKREEGDPGHVTAPRDQVQSVTRVCQTKQAASPSTWRCSRALEPCSCEPCACRPQRASARCAWPLQRRRCARDETAPWLHRHHLLLLRLLLPLLGLLLQRGDTTAPMPGTTCTSGTCRARIPVSLKPGSRTPV